MAEPSYLVDTSVLARAPQSAVGSRLQELAEVGRLFGCRLLDLVVVYGSRSGDVPEVISERLALPEAVITPEVLNRALHVAGLMAGAGLQRGAKPVDLVVAATAESANLTVLHYDDDYERIAKVTGQPTEWVAAPGTLDR